MCCTKFLSYADVGLLLSVVGLLLLVVGLLLLVVRLLLSDVADCLLVGRVCRVLEYTRDALSRLKETRADDIE
jgi:predicted transcriptional regulator